jgi:hypothetical protein
MVKIKDKVKTNRYGARDVRYPERRNTKKEKKSTG